MTFWDAQPEQPLDDRHHSLLKFDRIQAIGLFFGPAVLCGHRLAPPFVRRLLVLIAHLVSDSIHSSHPVLYFGFTEIYSTFLNVSGFRFWNFRGLYMLLVVFSRFWSSRSASLNVFQYVRHAICGECENVCIKQHSRDFIEALGNPTTVPTLRLWSKDFRFFFVLNRAQWLRKR